MKEINQVSLDQKSRDSALGFVGIESRATDQELLEALVAIIQYPERISDTNEFASLLADICDVRFIQVLIDKIANGVPGETLWLADYMYTGAHYVL